MKAKRMLGGILTIALLMACFIPSVQSMCNIPELIHLTTGQVKSYSFFLPVKVEVAEEGMCVSSSGDETLGSRKATLTSKKEGSTEVKFSLLGCIPLGSATLRVDDERVLIPGGQSIGLTMFTEGVFIVDTAQVYRAEGTAVDPAREAGLQSGDCILRMDGQRVDSMEELTRIVQNSTKSALQVEYLRDGKRRTTTVKPVVDESGQRRLGIWVRDSTAGIGTMTYMDPVAGSFGALGHAVTDMDTGYLLPIEKGTVYKSEITDVKRGSRGDAGELHGLFTGIWSDVRALDQNTEFGVYGRIDSGATNALYPDGLPIAPQSEVEVGPASILTTVDERGVQEFDCRIIKVTPQLSRAQRSMVIEITDPELLSITGGIVQGM